MIIVIEYLQSNSQIPIYRCHEMFLFVFKSHFIVNKNTNPILICFFCRLNFFLHSLFWQYSNVCFTLLLLTMNCGWSKFYLDQMQWPQIVLLVEIESMLRVPICDILFPWIGTEFHLVQFLSLCSFTLVKQSEWFYQCARPHSLRSKALI